MAAHVFGVQKGGCCFWLEEQLQCCSGQAELCQPRDCMHTTQLTCLMLFVAHRLQRTTWDRSAQGCACNCEGDGEAGGVQNGCPVKQSSWVCRTVVASPLLKVTQSCHNVSNAGTGFCSIHTYSA